MALDFVTFGSGIKALRQDVGTEDNGKVLGVAEGKIQLMGATEAGAMDLASAQTVTGIKTFSAVPQITSNATTDNGAIRKSQLDTAVTVGGDCSGTIGNLQVNTLFGGDTLAESVAALSPGGDISGTIANVSVDKIKGSPISEAPVTNGNVLVANGTSWGSTNLAGAGIAAASHTHGSGDLTGTVAHEKGGLELDVSGWTSGIPMVSAGATSKVSMGMWDFGKGVLGGIRGNYNFTDNGGTVGTKTLTATIPAAAIILHAFCLVLEAPTSGGAATIAIGYDGNNTALKAATAYDDASFAADACHALIPVLTTPSSYVSNTTEEEKALTLTIAGADLTAGEIDFFLLYVID